MADPALDDKVIHDEAAGWYARLNRTVISNQLLRDFRAWRHSDPRHDEAYLEIEEIWRRAARLENDPDIQKAAQDALDRKKSEAGRLRPGSKGVLAGLLLAIVGFGAMLGWQTLAVPTYVTAVGEQRYFRLADGSGVRLDTNSQIRVRLEAHERSIELIRGQAFFAVAHDAARPFIVRAADTQVRALGTRFDVRRDPAGVGITLVEGRVRVDAPQSGRPAHWTLQPGQQLVVSPRPAATSLRAVDAVAATSWTEDRLEFHATPLGTAIAEVNRYSRRKIVLQDEALAATPVSGAFETGDTNAFVAAVSDLYQLRADPSADGGIILRPRT